jgi:hypothetical protein
MAPARDLGHQNHHNFWSILVQELVRFGTGLLPLGCSPIQKMVVTMFLFQGYRCPDSGRGDTKCSGKNERKPTLRKGSSANLSDFLLALTLGDSAFASVELAKRDEIDESITAIV